MANRFGFEIGSTFLTLTNVEELTVPCLVGVWSYTSAQQRVELGSVHVRDLGPAEATWRFGVLRAAQRDQLRTFCSSGSAEVFITTRVNDSSTYRSFRCIMIWPIEEDHQAGRVLDLLIRFLLLEDVTPS